MNDERQKLMDEMRAMALDAKRLQERQCVALERQATALEGAALALQVLANLALDMAGEE